MAVKQFPNDFQPGAAVKLFGATTDGTLVYIIIPAGGETLQSVTGRNGETNKPILITDNILWTRSSNDDAGVIISGNRLQTSNYQNNGFKPLLFNVDGGNVGVGTSTPNQKLHVVGNILASGSITPGSDKRLKSKIRPLQNDVIDLINKLRPVSYILREDKASALGFIADEVREIFPDLVLEGKDEEKLLSMNYMGLTAPIVKAIQELHGSHVELQNKYNALLARVEVLEGN